MFEGINTKISRRYFVYLFVFAAANALVVCLLFPYFGAAFTASDPEEYLITARYFAGRGDLVGDNAAKLYGRLLKPVFPAFVGILSPVFGFKAPFIIVNAVLYLLIGFIVFKIVKLLFNNERQALVAFILFLTAYPILEYGINYYTDLAGWFFFVFSVYLTLLFGRKPSYKIVVLNGIISAVGFLTKESGGVGTLFFVLFLFFVYRDGFANRLKYLLVIAAAFWLPVVLWQALVFWRYNYSYLDWYSLGVESSSVFRQEYFRIVAKSLVAVFLLGWAPVLWGLAKIKEAASDTKRILLILVPPSFSFLLWPAASSRLFYIVGLLLSILASWGFACLINSHKHKFTHSLLAAVVAGNYLWFIFDDKLRILVNFFLKISY